MSSAGDTGNTWHKSYVDGCYVSTDGKYRAELRQPGFSEEFGARMYRHYAIFDGGTRPVGDARTLQEAQEKYLH